MNPLISAQNTVGVMPAVDVDGQDRDGNTPLMICAQYGFPDLVEMLCQKGANVDAQNDNGYCALHMVTSSESLVPEIIEILVANRARFDVVDAQYGSAPLHFLAGTGDLALCQKLIDNGAGEWCEQMRMGRG